MESVPFDFEDLFERPSYSVVTTLFPKVFLIKQSSGSSTSEEIIYGDVEGDDPRTVIFSSRSEQPQGNNREGVCWSSVAS